MQTHQQVQGIKEEFTMKGKQLGLSFLFLFLFVVANASAVVWDYSKNLTLISQTENFTKTRYGIEQ